MEFVDPYDLPEDEKRRIRAEHEAHAKRKVVDRPEDFAAALVRNDRRAFLVLLGRAGHPDDNPDYQGITLLHYAVLQKRDWAVEALLDKGADPNLVTLRRRTALDIALDPATPAPAAIIRLLAGRGALKAEDLSLGDIHAQLEARYAAVVARHPLDLPLLKGIIRSHPQQAKGFTDDFAHSRAGSTPLHRAVCDGREDLVRFWLEQGIAPDRRDLAGISALDLAVHDKVLQPLLAAAATAKKEWLTDETVINLPPGSGLAALRQPQSALAGDTLLYRLARHGDARDLVRLALTATDAGSKPLTVAELVAPTPAGKSALQLLAARREAEELLTSAVWAGRQKDLAAALDHLKDRITPKDRQRLLHEADVQTLRQQAKKNNPKLKF
jgi:hypothetical protein